MTLPDPRCLTPAARAGELALYVAQHGDGDGAARRLLQAFGKSPVGIDYRLMRPETFAPRHVAYADNLQGAAWTRGTEAARAARRKSGGGRPAPP
jgi:hypothetical protein